MNWRGRFLTVVPAIATGLSLTGGLLAWQPRTAAGQQTQPRYRVDVALVRLSVTARDAAGALVHDLAPNDFEVFEDGVPQEVKLFGHHDTPISVVVLFDVSGSMAGEKIMHAKDAVINFVRALGREDEVLVVAFGESVRALGEFGLDAKGITREVKRLNARQGTRLYDAVVEGSRAIASAERRDKRAILILSDGEDTASVNGLEQAEEAVKSAEVPVYAIGIEMDEAEAGPARNLLWRRLTGTPGLGALRLLTDGTGGWTYPVAAAGRCKEVCLRVADELRNQYLFGYYPTNREKDGRWRAITVRTTRPGVTLFTRSGYYAPVG
jgi:Ca-activated chloride channel family protein